MDPTSGISNTQTAYENTTKSLLDNLQTLSITENDLLRQTINETGVETKANGVNTSDLNNPETNKRIKKLLAEIENIEKLRNLYIKLLQLLIS